MTSSWRIFSKLRWNLTARSWSQPWRCRHLYTYKRFLLQCWFQKWMKTWRTPWNSSRISTTTQFYLCNLKSNVESCVGMCHYILLGFSPTVLCVWTNPNNLSLISCLTTWKEGCLLCIMLVTLKYIKDDLIYLILLFIKKSPKCFCVIRLRKKIVSMFRKFVPKCCMPYLDILYT